MTYEELVEIARADDTVVGLVLTGSRGRGYAVTEDADWDVRLVARDDGAAHCRERFATPHGSRVEVVVLSLSEFENAGEIGSPSAWDRYSYVDAEVVVDDPAGTIARLVREKGTLSLDTARGVAAGRLDDYVNCLYRAAKNERSGLVEEARLDAAESMSPLLDSSSRSRAACGRSTSSCATSSSGARPRTPRSPPTSCSSASPRSVRAIPTSSDGRFATSRR